MNKILITGADGFIGQQLCNFFKENNIDFLPVVRRNRAKFTNAVVIDDINSSTDWQFLLAGIDVVIHAAARVHVLQETADNPQLLYSETNVEGTLNLARQAAQCNVRRFIFISTIKVNGESTPLENPFTENDLANPQNAYGVSKYEAEQGLLRIAQPTSTMDVVIIRPPLVYGPGVKANFALMMSCINKSLPLPFGAVHNKRSLVALDNLVSFIVHCIHHPRAANEIFLISDGDDVSTPELIKRIASALEKRAFSIPVPVILMKFAAKLIGKGEAVDRLFCSLRVDNSKAKTLLGWSPVTTMEEQLKKTADAYLNETNV